MIDPTNFDFDTVTKPVIAKIDSPLTNEVSKKNSLVPIFLIIGGMALSIGVYLLFLNKNEKKYGT